MARQAIVRLVDDLDETIIEDGNGETVSFGIDDTDYEIDLTSEHASGLREGLARFVGVARKTGTSRRPRTRSNGRFRSSQSDTSPVAVREWAKAHGIEVSSRGRIPQSVVEQFKASGN